MNIEWNSYYKPVNENIIQECCYEWPNSLKQLYEIGDCPFIQDKEDKAPAYNIPELNNGIGFATYFLAIDPETGHDSYYRVSEYFSDLMLKEYTPIACDGGGEYLLFKSGRQEDQSIWHFSPNFRLDRHKQLFKVANNFDDFLTAIKFIAL